MTAGNKLMNDGWSGAGRNFIDETLAGGNTVKHGW